MTATRMISVVAFLALFGAGSGSALAFELVPISPDEPPTSGDNAPGTGTGACSKVGRITGVEANANKVTIDGQVYTLAPMANVKGLGKDRANAKALREGMHVCFNPKGAGGAQRSAFSAGTVDTLVVLPD